MRTRATWARNFDFRSVTGTPDSILIGVACTIGPLGIGAEEAAHVSLLSEVVDSDDFDIVKIDEEQDESELDEFRPLFIR